ncbi:MAG: proton-conducting transporter membrane subunit, partial [Nitrososphaerales archaeon]
VKAGVYLVARLFPIFFFGYWVAGFSEAHMFFLLAAGIGAFTAFLAGTQGLVAKELKKALAYSTMSQIGYMMLGFGVAGLSPQALIIGYTAGLFHLISHAIFKAGLFLGAGAVIHSADSIYMMKMSLSRKLMPRTWIFMWVAALSLSGVPPLSGFWSKDGILLSALEANAYWIFALALITVSITAFYSVRLMGLIFHKGGDEHKVEKEVSHNSSHHSGEPSYIMWLPYGILAVMTVGLGVIGPWFSGFLEKIFGGPFEEILELTNEHAAVGGVSPAVHYILPVVSVGMFLLGAYPAYRLYIKKNLDPAKIVSSYRSLGFLHRFLWNRWHIDRFYNRVFIGGTMSTRGPVANSVEKPMDRLLNERVPQGFLSMRRPTVRFIERPIDTLFNEMVPKISVVFSEIGRRFDEYVIDGIANGIASAGQVLSRTARRIQTGVTEEYAFAYIVGAVILALFLFYILIFGV